MRSFIAMTFLAVAFAGRTCCCGATTAEIDASLKKAIDFLYAQQHDGTWETVKAPVDRTTASVQGGQWGGLTAIATYALLSAEEDRNDPRIVKAIEFLEGAKLAGVYSVGIRAQIWPFMPRGRKYHELAARDAGLLMNSAKTKGPHQGLWSYFVDERGDDLADHSASQFAVLGVWACEEAGVEIPGRFWKIQDAIWRQEQLPNGAWSYVYQYPSEWGKPYVSMTCAGLASLYITQEKLDTMASRCKPSPPDAALAKGLDFVAQNYPADFDQPTATTWLPGLDRRQMYVIFGVSRLGLASGLRYFGSHDWFRTGSDYLLRTQRPDGSWGNTWETACGILFLARGQAPIAFNKLAYESPGNPSPQNWNVRPRDMANVTAWMGETLERRINWQIVDLKADPNDWLDAPILWISGPAELQFSDEQVGKLRSYVESGGMIVGNADCGSAAFTKSFLNLGAQMFSKYEFAELRANHPIYNDEQYNRAKWKSKPRIVSLGNGVRELMLLSSDIDLERSYQMRLDRERPEYYQLAADLYEYAAGLSLRKRGETIVVAADPAITTTRKARVARLTYAGNWDPEPGGWRRMANILHNQDKLELSIEPVELGNPLAGFALAHLTGTTAFNLTASQAAALAEYVRAGGTLLVDSAGGNAEFAASIEPQLTRLFAQPMQTLEPDAPLYTESVPPLTDEIAYTRFSHRILGNLKSPRLKAILIDRRPAVIFSAEDLSMGMVGQPVDGVNGYSAATAAAIVRRIVLICSKGH